MAAAQPASPLRRKPEHYDGDSSTFPVVPKSPIDSGLRRNDEIDRQNVGFPRLTIGMWSAEITEPNTYPWATPETDGSGTRFVLGLPKGPSAEGWFDRLRKNGDRTAAIADKLSKNGIGNVKSYKL